MNYSFLVGRINIKLENLLNFRLNNSKINSCSFNYVPMFSARVAPRNLKRTVSSRSCSPPDLATSPRTLNKSFYSKISRETSGTTREKRIDTWLR